MPIVGGSTEIDDFLKNIQNAVDQRKELRTAVSRTSKTND